ncbi:MAG: hypothetical protein MK116_04715 [Phycisphaerales bacterium]|nr:hypothetical protein [Phycisphaerales bacterium]
MSIRKIAAACAVLPAAGALAGIYTDPEGDINSPDGNLDIVGATVSHTDTDVTISLKLKSLGADWGKYVVLIDSGVASAGNEANPWGRDIVGAKHDYFIGSWLDGGNDGGAQFFSYSATKGGWATAGNNISQSVDWNNATISWTLEGFTTTLAAAAGPEGGGFGGFHFEIGTTGGGTNDPAIDLLGEEETQPGWGGTAVSTDMATYMVPAPGALALLGLAGLAGSRRRR